MKKNKKVSNKKQSLASQYREIVKTPRPSLAQDGTLRQPHLYKYVDTVTTYGAYEEPI